MTDIVERLRESADGWFNEVGTRHEAADEIERLRAEVEQWKMGCDTSGGGTPDGLCNRLLGERIERGKAAAERDAYASALRQIYIGAAESADGLTYSEIAAIAEAALAARGKDE